MFYENETISFHILDVLTLKQTNVNVFNRGRNFNALSFRCSSDAVLTTDTKTYPMQDNSITFIPAHLDYTRSAKTDELIVVHFETTDYNTRNIEYFQADHETTLGTLFQKILAKWEKKETGYRLQCSAILYEIFAECYRKNHQDKMKHSKIQASVEYIHLNFKNAGLRMKEISKQSFMSEVYFRKLFKAEYGISPQKYIMDLRIKNAAGLLLTGYYSLKEIAYASGYNDYKYFLVEFKKAMGVSPSEYAQRYINE